MNVSLNDSSGLVTITDDDTEVSISIDDHVTVNETADPSDREITVRLSAVSGETVTVD